MASFSARTSQWSPGSYVTYPHFFITITNYPHILSRARQHPQFNQPWQQQQQQQQQANRGGMFIPGLRIHYGTSQADIYERLLYNTLRYQLQEAIRAYLQRTRRAYPIHFIIDFSPIQS